jgi:diguanylate cyclase (GGDEF)-like protein
VPIAFLAAAAFAVVIGSLLIGGREEDDIALTRQRQTIENALDRHGYSLGRELRVQTVWNEAYERTRALDRPWMRAFEGQYLNELFGYDRIYVLAGDDQPVYGFADGRDERRDQVEKIAPVWQDLVAAVRDPKNTPAEYNVVTTPISLGDGQTVDHRAVADVRNIEGTPAMVVVSTIVPDRAPATPFTTPTFLLVAVENLDKGFTKRLGADSEFRDLEWIKGQAAPGFSTEAVKALNGTEVGTLAWRPDQPGWEFVRRMALGLITALLLLAALTALLMRWGRQQARKILSSEAEAKLAARTDALTGLPNRVALGEALPKMIEQASAAASTVCVLAIDIDQFKEINDDFGHAVGDGVLLAVADRLRTVLGPDALVARLDGDEFMALVPGVSSEKATRMAEELVSILANPIYVTGGTRVVISASLGYALAPQDGDRIDDLVRRVELALDKAKKDGGCVAAAFAPEMDLELSRRRALEAALRRALDNNAISVVYQPIMDATGTRVIAVESLARWNDPMLGPVSPEVFIPLAEETGLIQRIGEFVLRRAMLDGLAWRGVDVAVNVSAAQIHHGEVVPAVRDALTETRFPPDRLEIEITETVLLADEKRADEQIKGLQRLGVEVALDDFGAGHSSLPYLRKFGFDKLKIDRSFVEDIGNADDAIILASVIRLGLDLDLTITAEGVETPEQHQWLKASGCHQLQGFLFSRPLTAEEMTRFIAAHRGPAAAAG